MSVKTLEDITYEAGRHALADQEALVSGIRQHRHAAGGTCPRGPFLGGATIRAKGLDALGSIALASLVLGLVVAAALRLRGG